MSIITERQLIQKAAKPMWLVESSTKGGGRFCAYLKPNKDALFYFRYTDSQGKRKYIPLGPFDPKGNFGLTLKQARTKANELSSVYQAGYRDLAEHIALTRDIELADKQDRIAKIKHTQTFREVFDIWFDLDARQHKDGGTEVNRMFNKDILPALGELPIDKVQTSDVHKVLDVVLRRGASRQARLVLGRIRQVFNFAFERELIDINPTARIKKSKIGAKPNERDRVLTLEEINELSDAIDKAGLLKTTELAIWICLHTCCRIGELAKAKWSDIDLDRQLWTIPEANSKNGKSHRIHLSHNTLGFFRQLRTFSSSETWLYPNRSDTNHVDPKTFTKQIHDRQLNHEDNILDKRSKFYNALELPQGKWTLHDLRRTGATLMVANGVSPEVVERCLNHIEQNTIKRTYQHYSYETEMKAAWETLASVLSTAIPTQPLDPLP